MQNWGDNVFSGIPVGKDEPFLLGRFFAEHDLAVNSRKAVVQDVRKFARWFSATNHEPFTEAMADGVSTNERIEARMKDVEAAIKAIKDELIAKLPKAKRSGKVVTKDLEVEIVPVVETEKILLPAA